ncbi:MAG: hypothetical protein LUO89_12915 [Methanothrix sp.]|nr:hypothetical protein [Methanothrix sp.]
MITVYVESNFVLELVLEQEEHDACDRLLRSPRARVDLAIPTFALIEPDHTLQRHRARRAELARELEKEHGHIARTRSFKEEASNLKSVFANAAREAAHRYALARQRLTRRARLLPLDGASWREAERLHRDGLKLPDAVMLASVLVDRSQQKKDPACFLNRNAKDFAPFRDQLERTNCKLLASFVDGAAFIRHKQSTISSRRPMRA